MATAESQHHEALPGTEDLEPGIAGHVGALAVERYEDKPEIVRRVSAMLSDEVIESERESLAYQLKYEQQGADGRHGRNYYRLRDRLDATHLEPSPQLVLDGADSRVRVLEGMLQSTPKLERGTWFADAKSLNGRQILIQTHEQPLAIPMSNVVAIDSMQSWEGRGYRGSGEKVDQHTGVVRSSAEVIEQYASLDTLPPPVETATAFVQPNGLVFYEAGVGAHRAAAAMRRGDEMLQVDQLTVCLADQDYFELPPADNATSGN